MAHKLLKTSDRVGDIRNGPRSRLNGPSIAVLFLSVALLAASCSDSSSSESQAQTTTTDVTAEEPEPNSTTTASPDSSTTAAPTTVAVVTTAAPATTAPATTTTASPATTTTAAPTTTTTAAPATTTTAPACTDNGPVPGDAIGFETVIADFDVDGLPDQLMTYFSPSDDRFRIRYLPGVGGSFDVLITDSSSIGAVRPLGGFDVEGDGPLEAFVVVGSGASATLIGLYDVSECTISRVTLDGAEVSFPVGASIGSISGLTCDGIGHLDALFASNIGGDSYEGGFSPHTLTGNVLEQGFGDGASFESFEEAADGAGGFDCPPLTL